MKVYIKSWAEALKCAKESGVKHLVNTFNGIDRILGISHQHGDWGKILEAKKKVTKNLIIIPLIIVARNHSLILLAV